MEKIILYRYLEFVNKTKLSMWEKVKKLPSRIIVSFFAIYFFWSLGFVSQGNDWGELYTLGFILASVICCFMMSHFIEKYDIERSQGAKKELELYCESFKEFLSENGIITDEAIKLLYTRYQRNVKRWKNIEKNIMKVCLNGFKH